MPAEAFSQTSIDYERIEKAIQFLAENFHSQPSLKEIAAKIHVSEYHFQRLFSRWVGISPKRFLPAGKIDQSFRRYLRIGPDQPRAPA
jgi:AraC family transcriptional regulator of adaptative response/methylated-DNA-[protein]-cysteine methyltransferase